MMKVTAEKSVEGGVPMASTPVISGFETIARAAASTVGKRSTAPVERWNPPCCGDIGIEIGTDGSWWYQGSMITRRPLVELFASVLRKDEDGQTYLVTPTEKVRVTVADAPFLGVELRPQGTGAAMQLEIRTNLDDSVSIGPAHALRFETEPGTGGLKPYVLIRGRLEARLTREATRDLIALALDEAGPDGPPGVWSGGIWWPMAPT